MGSEIGLALGWSGGVHAAIVGSIILSVMSIPAAIVGARTRLSTYMIVRQVFGSAGSRIVNFVLAVVLIGWYAVTAELFGRTCYLTIIHYFPNVTISAHAYTIVSSLLVTVTTVFGFRALERLSLWVAPLLVALTCFVAWKTLGSVSWDRIGDDNGFVIRRLRTSGDWLRCGGYRPCPARDCGSLHRVSGFPRLSGAADRIGVPDGFLCAQAYRLFATE